MDFPAKVTSAWVHENHQIFLTRSGQHEIALFAYLENWIVQNHALYTFCELNVAIEWLWRLNLRIFKSTPGAGLHGG